MKVVNMTCTLYVKASEAIQWLLNQELLNH